MYSSYKYIYCDIVICGDNMNMNIVICGDNIIKILCIYDKGKIIKKMWI